MRQEFERITCDYCKKSIEVPPGRTPKPWRTIKIAATVVVGENVNNDPVARIYEPDILLCGDGTCFEAISLLFTTFCRGVLNGHSGDVCRFKNKDGDIPCEQQQSA